jgi:hypothetical protein
MFEQINASDDEFDSTMLESMGFEMEIGFASGLTSFVEARSHTVLNRKRDTVKGDNC